MSDRILEAQAAPPVPVFDFSDIMKGGQADIGKTVQERLAKGEFVAPAGLPTAEERAAHLIVRQLPSKYLSDLDPGIFLMSHEMKGYLMQANAASPGIDAEEAGVARGMWSKLTADERRQIESEYNARNANPNDDPVPTPHLNAFTKALTQQITPLEQQRDVQVQKVWKELPTETKIEIMRDQEERKQSGRVWT